MAALFSLLVAACILGACLSVGSLILRGFRVLGRGQEALPPPERVLFSVAAGMLALALVVLALGLAGLLRSWVLWGIVAVLLLAGLRCLGLVFEAWRVVFRAVRREVVGAPGQLAVYGFVVLWALVTLLSALSPPTDLDYDGVSQHLAAPKVYLRHGRIHPLWYDHHSHFPSTLQMLYIVALAAGRPEAAKVLHWACAVMTAGTLMVIGRRFVCAAAGVWAAFAFLVAPLIGWLSGVAYVDLASALFSALLLLAFLRWVPVRAAMKTPQPGCVGPNVALMGLAAGGGMAVKMQGLQVFAAALVLVTIALVMARESVARMARQVGLFTLVAALPAAPWYIKSLLWTGNPVYPFMYGVFGGKFWGPAEAAQYRAHQLGFGVGEPPTPSEAERMGVIQRTFSGPRAPLNLLAAPWNLTIRPAEFDVLNVNPIYAVISAGIGPLFLAVVPLLALTGAPSPVRWSLAFFALLWVAWLILMQYNRYLVPALPFVALPAGYVLREGLPRRGLAGSVPRAVAWACGVLALAYLCVSGLFTGAWAATVGLTPREAYLRTTSECYRVADWMNKVTPADSVIALYAEPRGFYLDREYLWADPGHSRLIEYEKIQAPRDLLEAYGKLGITHVLYRRLPGAGELFELPTYGTALAQLERLGQVRIVGHPPSDPDYVLLAIQIPAHREHIP